MASQGMLSLQHVITAGADRSNWVEFVISAVEAPDSGGTLAAANGIGAAAAAAAAAATGAVPMEAQIPNVAAAAM
jgi:hypothetical protein